MKKSSQVTLGLLVVMTGALGAAGCQKKVNETCVDKNGVVVADRYCDNTTTGTHYGYYRHYYGGSYHAIGQRVKGGSFSQPSGTKAVSVNSPSTRGVFGSRGSRGGS